MGISCKDCFGNRRLVVLVFKLVIKFLKVPPYWKKTPVKESFEFLKLKLKICDEPHPKIVMQIIEHCVHGQVVEACEIVHGLHQKGYSSEDILNNMVRVCKTANIPEYLKLEYIKVSTESFQCIVVCFQNSYRTILDLDLCRLGKTDDVQK